MIQTSLTRKPFSPQQRDRAWYPIVNAIAPGFSPYSCRDTFLAEQVALGVDPAVIASWIGSPLEAVLSLASSNNTDRV